MHGDGGIDQIASQRSEAGKCPLLVGPGKLAESDHIRRKKAASFRVSAMAVPSPHARLARLLIGLYRLWVRHLIQHLLGVLKLWRSLRLPLTRSRPCPPRPRYVASRSIGQAATLMVALHYTSFTHIHCGNYRGSKGRSRRTCRSGGRKNYPYLEGARNAGPRLPIGPEGKSLGRCPDVHLWNDLIPVNRINSLDTVASVIFSESVFGTRPSR